MRRKQGQLVTLERAIIEVAQDFRRRDCPEFYASQSPFTLAVALKIADGHPVCPSELIRKGTIYRALNRLEAMGLLKSRWEVLIEHQGRPPRRYYSLTDGDNEC